jgi:hypothetical protein
MRSKDMKPAHFSILTIDYYNMGLSNFIKYNSTIIINKTKVVLLHADMLPKSILTVLFMRLGFPVPKD